MSDPNQGEAVAWNFKMLAGLFHPTDCKVWYRRIKKNKSLTRAIFPEKFESDDFSALYVQAIDMKVYPYSNLYCNQRNPLAHSSSFHTNTLGPYHFSNQLAAIATFIDEENLKELESMLNYLLAWLPLFIEALIYEGEEVFSGLGQLAYDSAVLCQEILHLPVSCPATGKVSKPPSLEDHNTNLGEIADYLISPSAVGFLLTKSSMKKIAVELKIAFPGFGTRASILKSIFIHAGYYDQTNGLFLALQSRCKRAEAFYEKSPFAPNREINLSKFQDKLKRSLSFLDKAKMMVNNHQQTPS